MPCTARRSDQLILKEINLEYSLKGLMLKLELQYFSHLTQTPDSLEETLMLGKTEGKRRERERMRWLDSITDLIDMNLGKLWDIVRDRETCCAVVHGVTKSWTWLSNWTTIVVFLFYHAPDGSLYNSCLQPFTSLSWKYPKHRISYSSWYCSQIMPNRYMCSITVELNFWKKDYFKVWDSKLYL